VSNPGGNPGNWVGVTNCDGAIWVPLLNDESHLSWLNDASDSNSNCYPIMAFFLAQSTNTANPYDGELDMFSMATANAALTSGSYEQWASTAPTVWRIAHTYNDPVNSQCAQAEYTDANISSDGKYIVFFSDWMGQTGKGNCTNNRRLDVFVAKLPLP